MLFLLETMNFLLSVLVLN